MSTTSLPFTLRTVGSFSLLQHPEALQNGFEHGFIGRSEDFRLPVSAALAQRFCRDLRVRSLVLPNQKHTDKVHYLPFDTLYEKQLYIPEGEYDALVMSASSCCSMEPVAIGVRTADCVPLLIKCGDSYAAVHAGWRGLASEIIRNTCEKLLTLRGNADRMPEWQFLIGPCAGVERYEVGDEILGDFRTNPHTQRRDGMLYLDLVSTTTEQISRWLEARGLFGSISSAHICTISEQSFHSFRRDKELRGSNVSFVVVRPTSDP